MFTPVLPGNALSAWGFLKESRDDQLAALGRDPTLSREAAHFANGVTRMTSVEDLVGDYMSLKVALGAHALQDDLPNRYFVRQVIEQGVEAADAFANRLNDSRYLALAQNFAELGLTGTGDLSDAIGALDPALDAAVRDVHGASPLHLATAERLDGLITLGLLGTDTSERQWTRAAGDATLAPILARMLGTADSLTRLDTEGQGAVLAETAGFLFGQGSLSALIDPDNAFAAADAYLGTGGQPLSGGFSYGGLAAATGAILDTYTDDADRWAALQADPDLRAVVADGLSVAAGFDALSAADQIAALQDAALARFGRAEFGLFASQANLTVIGDTHLSPEGAPLSQDFTLGGFTAAVAALRDAGAPPEQAWDSVLSVAALQTSLATAFGIEDGFAALPADARVARMMAETQARFGAAGPEALGTPQAVATLAGLTVETRVTAMTDAYLEESFRVAVGEVRPELRVALSVADAMQAARDTGGTDTGAWFRVLGSNVLRETFETAFGLDANFAQLPVDAQVETLRSYSRDAFGTDRLADLAEPDRVEALITRYLSRVETNAAPTAPTLGLFQNASAASILATLYGTG